MVNTGPYRPITNSPYRLSTYGYTCWYPCRSIQYPLISMRFPYISILCGELDMNIHGPFLPGFFWKNTYISSEFFPKLENMSSKIHVSFQCADTVCCRSVRWASRGRSPGDGGEGGAYRAPYHAADIFSRSCPPDFQIRFRCNEWALGTGHGDLGRVCASASTTHTQHTDTHT